MVGCIINWCAAMPTGQLHEIVTQLSIDSLQLHALLTGCEAYCRLYDVMEVGLYGLYYDGLHAYLATLPHRVLCLASCATYTNRLHGLLACTAQLYFSC